jgi:hypothetical protein
MNPTIWRRLARGSGIVSFLIAFALPSLGQGIHLGVKAGVPLTEFFQTGFAPSRYTGFGTQYSAATRRYTVGLFMECRLYHGLGLEVEAQYKRMGYVHDETTYSYSPTPGTTIYDVKGHSWDFPGMGKYRFGRSQRPFVSAGGTFRHIGPVRARGASNWSYPDPSWHTVTYPIDTSEPDELNDRNFSGLTISGGFEFGRGWLRLFPELRYTHWLSNMGSARSALRLNPHQWEFLLGLDLFHR